MTKANVFVTRQIPENGLNLLREQCAVQVHSGELPPTRDELLAGVAGCSGVLSLLSDRIDEEVLDAAGPQLKVVANFAVGFNNIDLSAAKARGVSVGNTPDVLTDATADIALALLMSVARRLPQSSRDVRQARWRTWEPLGWIGQDLIGKTIGIVGMGRIGTAVARRLHFGWKMRVLYTSRTSKPDVDGELSAEHVTLDALLESSDFVSLHLPLNEETRHTFSGREFRCMKPGAILINTARGEIIDQRALTDALRNREIFGAGLDVCTPEPLPAEHELLKLDNCLILPHIGSATQAARGAMSERAARNILAGIQGNSLPFEVV